MKGVIEMNIDGETVEAASSTDINSKDDRLLTGGRGKQ
jgi:hypothetical protein